MERFCRWRYHGENSVTGVCFDVGDTTAAALHSYRATGEPLSGSTDPGHAGNGSLMRLAPVAIRWWRDGAQAAEAARLQSRTTHGAVQAVEACALFAEILVESIAGLPKESVLRPRTWDGDARIAELAAGSWRTKERDGRVVPTPDKRFLVRHGRAEVYIASRVVRRSESVTSSAAPMPA